MIQTFTEHYEQADNILIFEEGIYFNDIELFLERQMTAKELMSLTSNGRRTRGSYEVKRVQNTVKEIGKSPKVLEKLEYRCRSTPSTTGQNHFGYVIYEPKTLLIHQLFCSCPDFFLRYYYLFVKQGMATFDLEPKYRMKDKARLEGPLKMGRHNEMPPSKINSTNTLEICKHLFCICKFYLVQSDKVKEPIVEPKIVPKVKPKDKPEVKVPEKKIVEPVNKSKVVPKVDKKQLDKNIIKSKELPKKVEPIIKTPIKPIDKNKASSNTVPVVKEPISKKAQIKPEKK